MILDKPAKIIGRLLVFRDIIGVSKSPLSPVLSPVRRLIPAGGRVRQINITSEMSA